MTSMLNTSANVQHVTQLPPGIPAEKGVKLVQDHIFFISIDPHLVKYEALDAPSEPLATIPEDRGVTAISAPESYKVTHVVHTLPAGLWDSDVESTCDFINVEKGVFVKLRSPLSVQMETLWHVRETPDGGAELVEDILIKCSRLLIGTVKSTCEAGWRGIHEKMMAKLQEMP